MKNGNRTAQTLLFSTLALLCAIPFLIQASEDKLVADGPFGVANSSAGSVQTAAALKSTLNPEALSYQGGGDIRFAGTSALRSAGHSPGSGETATRRAGTVSLYVVREGDALGEIASMFNVSINTIVWANDIEDRTIQPGDTLIILPMSGIRHTVAEGDTLKSIANKYNGDLTEIAQFNGLNDDDSLAVGDVIDIPNGERDQPESSVRTAPSGGDSTVASGSSGWLIRPVNGVRTQGIHGYNGVDYGAAPGTGVVAAAGGEVIVSRTGGWNGGYGNYVIIKHPNGVQTLYSHLSTVLVGRGQSVVQGEVIGYVGNTGKSTGPHLHFEVRGATNPF